MNDAQFGKICGISQQMVSKYRKRGLVVNDERGEIDPLETLRLLDGHLDEDKRLAALHHFTEGGEFDFDGAEEGDESGLKAPPRRSARTMLDEIRLESARIDLQAKAGKLIQVEEVEASVIEAVSALKMALGTAGADLARDLEGTFGVPFDKRAGLKPRLRRFEMAVLGAFSEAMAKFADAPVGASSKAGRAPTD